MVAHLNYTDPEDIHGGKCSLYGAHSQGWKQLPVLVRTNSNPNPIPNLFLQLNSTPPEGGLNKGKEARKLKNIPDSLNDSQVFF